MGDNTGETPEQFVNNIQLNFKDMLKEHPSVSDIAPQEGCLILGKGANRGNSYLTRFRIQRSLQREEIAAEVCEESCMPCCLAENRRTWKRFLWICLTCEPFLLTLHMTALILGVLKEALNLRTVDEDLHMIHSIIETFVACLVVVTRIAAVWGSYRTCKRDQRDIEYSERDSLHDDFSSMRRVVVLFTVFAVFLILFAVAAFLVFYFFAHLGWTILSNNFVLIMVTVTSNLVSERLDSEIAKDKEDQHKAVIYETMLLLTEMAWARTREQKEHIYRKVERFCRALRDTEAFSQPHYINCPDEHQPKWDAVTQMEMQSFV